MSGKRELCVGWALRIPALAVAFLFVVLSVQAQTDPGVRGGAAGAGGALPGLTIQEGKFFSAGLDAFNEIQSVLGGTVLGQVTEPGLGPRFNLDSCAGCHAQPATGGTSPFTNPQVGVATKNGATNSVPSFITINGPVREVRFKFNPDGSRDGGVHDLFTITGRADAQGPPGSPCNIAQPDFSNEANRIFRIPTPTFGAGMIEAVMDSAILANKAANASAKSALGITGHENREGNAGTITRFGWKAQNKSLVIFSGEAYNVEQGVTNELFQQERDETPSCRFNSTPEDHTSFTAGPRQDLSSDAIAFANFMRFLAPPTPVASFDGVSAESIARGLALFTSNPPTGAGCYLCHTPSLQTGSHPVAALSNKAANLFSDLLVHHMGTGLADDIFQGNAVGDEFRTAPLWGLGQRIFFLHDGRTDNLLKAIQAHSSTGSEANGSIAAFNALPATGTNSRQDILNFLRAL